MNINIHNLHEKTAQEVFDYIVNHLRQQGEQSIAETGSICSYRGISKVDGRPLMCAAGCLIPDDLYSHQLEQNRWFAVTKRMIGEKGLIHADSYAWLINDLQFTHDLTHFPRNTLAPVTGEELMAFWEEQFQIIANKYGIAYTAP